MRASRLTPMIALTTLLALSASASAQPASQYADKETARAREILRLFIERKFDDLVKQGNELMQANFTALHAQAAHARIAEAIGEYQSELSSRLDKRESMSIVEFSLRYERG